MNEDIGFVLIKLLNNKTYDSILYTVEQFIKCRPYQQHVVFNSYSEKSNTFNVPIFHLQQAQFFDGKLILFDIPSVILSNQFPNISKRILFTSDTHWTQTTTVMYEQWRSIYEQENLDIIVTSPVLNDLYSMCWKRPIATVEQFTYEELSKYI
jgi:hypothetical protein